MTHPLLELGGAVGGAPSPTVEPGSSGSGPLAAASSLNSLPNPPQTLPEGRRETLRRATRRPLKGLCFLSRVMAGMGRGPGALLLTFLQHPTVGISPAPLGKL